MDKRVEEWSIVTDRDPKISVGVHIHSGKTDGDRGERNEEESSGGTQPYTEHEQN
jgi:hypothetical protein